MYYWSLLTVLESRFIRSWSFFIYGLVDFIWCEIDIDYRRDYNLFITIFLFNGLLICKWLWFCWSGDSTRPIWLRYFRIWRGYIQLEDDVKVLVWIWSWIWSLELHDVAPCLEGSIKFDPLYYFKRLDTYIYTDLYWGRVLSEVIELVVCV